MSFSYAPEVLTRLFRERLDICENYVLAKINKGVLTLEEVMEDNAYWKERMSMFYENMGWDSKLIEILDN